MQKITPASDHSEIDESGTRLDALPGVPVDDEPGTSPHVCLGAKGDARADVRSGTATGTRDNARSGIKAVIRADARLSDELAAYLDQGSFTQSFTIERVLSSGGAIGADGGAPAETTTLIRCPSGELRVRKTFAPHRSSTFHIAPESVPINLYALLQDAQARGRCRTGFPRVLALHDDSAERIVELEYVDGPTLSERIDTCRNAQERLELACEVFGPLCRVTHELHSAFEPPLIHRDIKPSNVIAPVHGTIALIDFGIARIYNPVGETDTVHLGTRSYAPPEQFGFGQTTVCSDVYSLGATLFCLLTGREATSTDRTAEFAAIEDSAFRGIVSRACAFDPHARYASALDLERAFEKAAGRKRAELKAIKRKEEKRRLGRNRPKLGKHSGPSHFFGRCWNVCFIFAMAITVMGCFYALDGEYRYPLWLRVIIYIPLMIPSLVLGFYAFMDKRRRKLCIPAVSQLAWWQESLLWIALSAVIFFIAVVFESIGHWLWPM